MQNEPVSCSKQAIDAEQPSFYKVHKAINFSVELDITSHCSQGLRERNGGLFTLCGVLVHQGASASQGHYFGYFKRSCQQWLRYDDSFVRVASQQEVLGLTRLAYMLVYEAVPHYETLR